MAHCLNQSGLQVHGSVMKISLLQTEAVLLQQVRPGQDAHQHPALASLGQVRSGLSLLLPARMYII